MAYSEKVIEHYENPRNVGSFDKDDPSVGTGLVGAPACGPPSTVPILMVLRTSMSRSLPRM